jgi:hypothetical protein
VDLGHLTVTSLRAGPVRVLPCLVAALAAALAVTSVSTQPVALEAGTSAWRRLVRGARADGLLGPRATILLPGVSRREASVVIVRADSAEGKPVALDVAVDGGSSRPLRAGPGEPLLVGLPAATAPGARLDLVSVGDAVVTIRSVRLGFAAPWLPGRGLVAGIAAVLLVLALGWRLGGAAFALGLAAAALLALAAAPRLLWLSLPDPWALGRLAPALAAALGALVLGVRSDVASRRALGRAAALAIAFVFGVWIRGLFLPSAGSWDTEYWKTWMLRATSHGLARVYGDAEPFDAGRLQRQARGAEPVWQAPRGGRDYPVDYPPLAMAAWRASWWLVTHAAPRLGLDEAENVAVKLPAVVGDIAGALFLLYALRETPERALTLAALYWALPVSWLSSSVLGFLDAALTPLTAAALLAAGRGRARACGIWLALACLVKPTAGIVAPAAIVALLAGRGSVGRGACLARAAASGLATTAIVFIPFAFAGTLPAAIVQVFRIFFQERLSGGFPNPWWLLGHLVTVARQGDEAFWQPVRFVRVEAVPVPAPLLGLALFLAWALFVASRQRGQTGPGPAFLSGAVLLLGYSLFAIGVHENHPHPLYLLLFATGLSSARLRLFTALTSAVYVLNMLAMSGLGRFYGPRFFGLEPVIRAAGAFRMALGIDVTLLLTFVNLFAFVWMISWLGDEMRAMTEPKRP